MSASDEDRYLDPLDPWDPDPLDTCAPPSFVDCVSGQHWWSDELDGSHCRACGQGYDEFSA